MRVKDILKKIMDNGDRQRLIDRCCGLNWDAPYPVRVKETDERFDSLLAEPECESEYLIIVMPDKACDNELYTVTYRMEEIQDMDRSVLPEADEAACVENLRGQHPETLFSFYERLLERMPGASDLLEPDDADFMSAEVRIVDADVNLIDVFAKLYLAREFGADEYSPFENAAFMYFIEDQLSMEKYSDPIMMSEELLNEIRHIYVLADVLRSVAE